MKRTLMTILVAVVAIAVMTTGVNAQSLNGYFDGRCDQCNQNGNGVDDILREIKDWDIAKRGMQYHDREQEHHFKMPYWQLLGTDQDRRISRLKESQEIQEILEDNRNLQESVQQATAALTKALEEQRVLIEQQKVLVAETGRLQNENRALRAKDQLMLQRIKQLEEENQLLREKLSPP